MSFRFHKQIPILSLFHRSSVQSSANTLKLLREHPVIQKHMATLEVATSPPTRAQLETITSYLGGGYSASKIVDGAKGLDNAVEILQNDESKLNVPVLVDWEGGRVVLGGDKERVEHLLEEIRKAA
jgi:arsenate reductase-like glutaredoxin family protein